jgi:uncharacterized membrane protein
MGPVQILVVGFGEDADFRGEALAELKRLSEQDIVRLIDLLIVRRQHDGSIEKVEISDEHELSKLGAFAGALIGFGAAGDEGAEAGAEAGAELGEGGSAFSDEDVWYLADAIPAGSTAAICLLEHRWAIPLRTAIVGAGGVALADRWLHPEDLLAAGAEIGLAIGD